MGHKRQKNCQIGATICPGPRGACQNFFLFSIVIVGGTFQEVITQIYRKVENCSICGSVSVFVRWVIWHQEGYNGNIVSHQWILRPLFLKHRTANGAILPFSVNLSDHLQKSASHNQNSEWRKILTSSPGTWTYGNTDMAVFVLRIDHFPCGKSILLDFAIPRLPTILGCESQTVLATHE